MKRLCKKCKTFFEPTNSQIKKRVHLCLSCQREHDLDYREKRKEQGNPVVSGNMSRDWHREYEKKRYENPEARKRRNKLMRKYTKDLQLRHKFMARWITNKAIKSGGLKKMPCEICGNIQVEAHHEDYYQPLMVNWLCKMHHQEHHNKAKGA